MFKKIQNTAYFASISLKWKSYKTQTIVYV